MTARVLIVDDVPANLKLLEAKLMAEYFGVLQASSGPEALEMAVREKPDIILLDVMMPGMDGFEVCRRLRAMPETSHVPIIMVTALDQQKDRVEGLEAGADDFLTKPVDDVALFARVKSLVRLKMLTDELRMREETGQRIGLVGEDQDAEVSAENGQILLLDDRTLSRRRIVETLSQKHSVTTAEDGDDIMRLASTSDFDIIIVSLSLEDADGLRLCSQLRSHDATRSVPVIVLVEEGNVERLVRALDMGVNDYVVRPIERHELMARVRTQLRHKRYQEKLRISLHASLEMAVTDPLTGLHNRRYMTNHLTTQVDTCGSNDKHVCLLVLDIDFFKLVNDTYGHPAGDEVLKEFAKRLKANVRGIDLPCRFGGEEFVVVMPDTDVAFASSIAERLREQVADVAFEIPDGSRIDVTVSIGVASTDGPEDTVEALLERADQALYRAKREGRNRVVADAA
ncbi:MAG: two-component system cell cycle response regulator [Parvibaculaceae bacterium]|nr:PleD family two-component system response regulator [Parvibaculaceae bacterium]